jgi:hypothetical protein
LTIQNIEYDEIAKYVITMLIASTVVLNLAGDGGAGATGDGGAGATGDGGADMEDDGGAGATGDGGAGTTEDGGAGATGDGGAAMEDDGGSPKFTADENLEDVCGQVERLAVEEAGEV